MNRVEIFLCLCLTLMEPCLTLVSGKVVEFHFTKFTHHEIPSSCAHETSRQLSRMRCAEMCAETDTCLAFDYEDGTCRLATCFSESGKEKTIYAKKTKILKRFYLIVCKMFDYQTALDACKKINGSLAVPETLKQMDNLRKWQKKLMTANPNCSGKISTWVDLRNPGRADEIRTPEGTKLTYAGNWDHDKIAGEDMVLLGENNFEDKKKTDTCCSALCQ